MIAVDEGALRALVPRVLASLVRRGEDFDTAEDASEPTSPADADAPRWIGHGRLARGPAAPKRGRSPQRPMLGALDS